VTVNADPRAARVEVGVLPERRSTKRHRCRVVATVEEPDEFGFAYGTLPMHPERGEESFIVRRLPGGVLFTIRAASQPAHPLARLAPPVANLLRGRAVGRYLEAMAAVLR
jgi:uncharacterized protein (UPF0548 family)